MTIKYKIFLDFLNVVFNERKKNKKLKERDWAEAILHYLGPNFGTYAFDPIKHNDITDLSVTMIKSIGSEFDNVDVSEKLSIQPAIPIEITFSVGQQLLALTKKRSAKSLEIEGKINKAEDIFIRLTAEKKYSEIETLKKHLVNDKSIEWL